MYSLIQPHLKHLTTGIFILSWIFLQSCSSNISQKKLAQLEKVYQEETAIISKDGASLVDSDLNAVTSSDLDQDGEILVVAWKSAESAKKYYNAPGSLDTLDSSFLTWVVKESQYPEIIEDFRLDRMKGQKLALRLEQLLGLPPAADTTRVFLSIRLKGEDLFRPCRNPDISDCSCSTEFPFGYYSEETGYSEVYETIVGQTTDFPWTRLGYTYDWNPRNRNHFGFSEYIIRQGAVVKIISKVGTEEFINAEQ